MTADERWDMSERDGKWMREQYENEELEDIRDHGCVSGCAGGLIYYSETTAIYDQYAEELHELIESWAFDCGTDIPKEILENFGYIARFKNAVVWTATEIVADEILNLLELA